MGIVAQLYLITGGLAVLSLVAAWQAFRIRAFLRSKSSLFGAFIFLLWGARQVYILISLGNDISDARAKGIMIDHLSAKQWIVGVIWSYAIAIGFVTWQHWKHLDFKKLGI